MNNLSERLSLIAEFTERGSAVCDVGTDHGYLPAFLYLSGEYKSVCATDIRPLPLQNARANLERLGANGVRLVLCDGLAGVTREMADNVIIAGMGGEVISGIIDRAPFVRDSSVSLILQPMTAARELREYLAREGFAVEREEALCENSKVYSVMKVRFTGEGYNLDSTRAVIGLLNGTDEASKAYIKKQYNIAFKCARDLEKIESRHKEHLEYKSLAENLKNILEDANGI